VDEREADPKDNLVQLQPSVNIAIAETSETEPEVSTPTLLPPQGSPDASIQVEDKPGLPENSPVFASTFPDLISSSEPQNLMTDAQENNFSADAQIDTHTALNPTPGLSTMIAVKVTGAQGIVLPNGKSDSFVAEDFAWTCGSNPAISHVKIIARGNSEVHMVNFTLSMTF